MFCKKRRKFQTSGGYRLAFFGTLEQIVVPLLELNAATGLNYTVEMQLGVGPPLLCALLQTGDLAQG